MHRITNYQVIIDTPEELSKRVKKMIGQGWQPFGAPFDSSTGDDTFFGQAIVIYGELLPVS